MEMHEMKVRVTFTEPVLGTQSGNPDLHEEFIASKAPTPESMAEEVEALIDPEEEFEKALTVFPWEDGHPFFWNYQIKGAFKEACGFLRKVKGTKSSGLRAYKKQIDGLVFVKERRIPVKLSGKVTVLQRPLRASTAQGERICLASSEVLPAGSSMEFTVQCLVKEDLGYVREWMDYLQIHGMGQWRNAGWGTIEWEEIG